MKGGKDYHESCVENLITILAKEKLISSDHASLFTHLLEKSAEDSNSISSLFSGRLVVVKMSELLDAGEPGDFSLSKVLERAEALGLHKTSIFSALVFVAWFTPRFTFPEFIQPHYFKAMFGNELHTNGVFVMSKPIPISVGNLGHPTFCLFEVQGPHLYTHSLGNSRRGIFKGDSNLVFYIPA